MVRPAYSRLRIALVRHGESNNNIHEATGDALTYWRFRTADPDLTARGRRQAELLAEHLADEKKSQFWGLHPISELWVSPVKRTMQTIHPLAETKLRRNGGPYYGTALVVQSSSTAEPAVYECLKPMVQVNAFEQGGLFERAIESENDATGEFHLGDMTAHDAIWFRHFNTGVTIVDICGVTGQTGVVCANSIDHLRDHPELVSGFPLGNVKSQDG
eukprot:g13798.t1